MGYTGRLPKAGVAKITKQVITGDGGTSYALDKIVGNAADIEVYVNNVRQEPNVAYTVTGTTIEFTGALSASDSCYLVYQGHALLTTDLTDYYVKSEVDTAIGNVDLTNLAPDSFVLPSYASDPTGISAGYIYFNTTDSVVKHYDGANWYQVTNKFSASGGTVTTVGNYKVHTFTSSGTFVADSTGSVDVIVVAGGGAGGYDVGGGGGAGGVIVQTGYTVTPGSHSITIGAGGSPSTSSTGSSSGSGGNTSFLTLNAIGGGGGGDHSAGQGANGGSGGGGAGYTGGFVAAGAGTSGQGYNGGAGRADLYGSNSTSGGGGGAGGQGSEGINNSSSYAPGGAGINNNFQTGSNQIYGAGGEGGGDLWYSQFGDATANTGNGGAGAGQNTFGHNPGRGSAGGSGIVIIRYPI